MGPVPEIDEDAQHKKSEIFLEDQLYPIDSIVFSTEESNLPVRDKPTSIIDRIVESVVSLLKK